VKGKGFLIERGYRMGFFDDFTEGLNSMFGEDKDKSNKDRSYNRGNYSNNYNNNNYNSHNYDNGYNNGYNNGGYDNGSYNNGSYNNGGYNNGGYNNDGYDNGGYNNGYNNGGYDNGSYDNGSYNNGGYNDGGYDNGGYNNGGYNNGGYDNGGYNNGGYNNGGYDNGYNDDYTSFESGNGYGRGYGSGAGYNREKEIQEAIFSGKVALECLGKAKKSLDSAGNWGLVDIFGGGLISGIMKHSRIDDAKAEMDAARYALRKFKDQLDDVRDIDLTSIDVGSFTTFADFFFDGFLMDFVVQSKISEAKRQVDEAIWKVKGILETLYGMR